MSQLEWQYKADIKSLTTYSELREYVSRNYSLTNIKKFENRKNYLASRNAFEEMNFFLHLILTYSGFPYGFPFSLISFACLGASLRFHKCVSFLSYNLVRLSYVHLRRGLSFVYCGLLIFLMFRNQQSSLKFVFLYTFNYLSQLQFSSPTYSDTYFLEFFMRSLGQTK